MPLLATASLLAGLATQAPDGDAPTFNRDVAPIVFEHCSVCHRPGQSAPFSLLSYEDVESRAEQIVDVVSSRYMPPWLPAPGSIEFEGNRRLEAKDIATLERWLEAGVPEGEGSELPAPPEFPEGWMLGEPDLIIEMEAEYTLPPEGFDVFRSFVFRVPIDTPRHVRAVELQPGNKRIVHHAVMMIDDTGASRRLDAKDEEVGFPGMDASSARAPDGHFLGWTPGKMPSLLPEDLAWTLNPGTELVLQLHLLPTGKPEPVRPRVGLFFSERPPERTPVLLRLGSLTLDIPAGDEAYTIEDRFTLPVPVTVIGVYPHAHYLGKSMMLDARPPDGEELSLLRIDDWDFNWQDDYRYSAPVPLPAGTVLHGSIAYDNSENNVRNPRHPPERVIYGANSSEEMGDLWIQVVPDDEAEYLTLMQAFYEKDLLLQLEGYRFAVQENPDSPHPRYNLGLCLLQTGDFEGARRDFEKALELDPDHVSAHENLAILQAESGEFEAARAHMMRVLEIEPGHPRTLANLGALFLTIQDFEEARRHLLEALRANPKDLKAHLSMVQVSRHFGDLDGLLDHLSQAVALQPGDIGLRLQTVDALLEADRAREALTRISSLEAPESWRAEVDRRRAEALEGLGRDGEAVIAYVQLLEQGAQPQAALRLAWILSTSPDDSVRDGKQALFWARGSADRLSQDPAALDVLAAAFAEAGRFKKAQNTAKQALALARGAGDASLAEAISLRLASYLEEKAWRAERGEVD